MNLDSGLLLRPTSLLSGQPPHPALLSVPHTLPPSVSPSLLCPAPLWSTGPGQTAEGWQGAFSSPAMAVVALVVG